MPEQEEEQDDKFFVFEGDTDTFAHKMEERFGNQIECKLDSRTAVWNAGKIVRKFRGAHGEIAWLNDRGQEISLDEEGIQKLLGPELHQVFRRCITNTQSVILGPASITRTEQRSKALAASIPVGFHPADLRGPID